MPQKSHGESFTQEDAQKGKYLTFSMGHETYGIEIRYVIEIIGFQPMTEVPEQPEYNKGIINLRGAIIPVMDIRLRFKKQFKEYNNRTCIIVVDVSTTHIGLIVDGVSEVITIPEEEIVALPETNAANSPYIQGVGKIGNDVKLILNCFTLFDENVIANIGNTTVKN